jgi:uncharacterized membrane protein YkvA (DUF1232 family)
MTATPTNDDPPAQRNPLADLPGILGRLPRYLALGRELLRDPQLPKRRKAALAGGIAYVASPIDLVPGIIPVAGQLDDLAALFLSLRYALGGCPPARRELHLRTVGLEAADLERDLATVRSAAGWIAGRIAGGTIRLGKATVSVAGRGIGAAGRLLGRAVAGRRPDRPRS